VYRNSILLEYALDHLTRSLTQDAEILIVDDASGSETLETIRKFGRARVIPHEENRGNTVAYNTGAKAASGEVLVFMDSDILVDGYSLAIFQDILHSEPRVGAVGCLLTYPQNYTIQHAGVAFDRWTVSHVYTGQNPDSLAFSPLEERQAVTAALFACRRAVFQEVGGFDETYRDGLEDIDFCLKCRKKNYRNLLTTRLKAMHLESATRGPYKSIRRTYNYNIFYSRWAPYIDCDLPEYIERQFGSLKESWPANHATRVINLCNTPNWHDLMQPMINMGLSPSGVHDFSGFVQEGDPIDLFRSIPLAFHKSPNALLFITDHFSQLEANQFWFSSRQAPHMIVDRHANVCLKFPGSTT
jgi:GT2 family glycosyltransferase